MKNIIEAIQLLIEEEKAQTTTLKSLAQLRKIFAPLNINVYRSPAGYYYFVAEGRSPSNGVYTYRVEGTTLSFWLTDALEYIQELN